MKVLHIGCGGNRLPWWLEDVEETRLDIDSQHNPDIVASMLDLGDIGEFDVVYCSHALEHLHWHEVDMALKEFLRVLRDRGLAIIFVPDVEGVQANEEVLFDAPCGPITGLDLIYGHRELIKENPHMQHKTGFMMHTLDKKLQEAGFTNVNVKREIGMFNLYAMAVK